MTGEDHERHPHRGDEDGRVRDEEVAEVRDREEPGSAKGEEPQEGEEGQAHGGFAAVPLRGRS